MIEFVHQVQNINNHNSEKLMKAIDVQIKMVEFAI